MAAEAVGNLYATLGLNTGGFDSGIASAQKKLGEFGKIRVGDGLKAGFGEVENALTGLAGSAGAVGGILSGLGIAGAAAAAAIGVAFQGAREAMAFGDEVADTAANLRVSTDYLQEMRWAAREFGVEFEDADAALEGFSKTLGLATSGLSAKAVKAVKPFEALGLDPKSFASVEDALGAVADKIAGLGSAAEQAAVADKLGLTPILPALREGSRAIDDMRRSAHEWGSVMDAEMIQKAAEAQGELDRLTYKIDIQFKSAMTDAIPLVVRMADLLGDGATAAGDFAEKLGDIAAGLQATTSAGPAWAKNLTEFGLKSNPFAIGFGNLGAMIDAAALRGKAAQASKLSDWLGSGSPTAKAAPVDKPGERLVDVAAQQKAAAESRREMAKAAREAAAAEREQAAGLKALADAMRESEQRSADFAASLLEEITTMGMSSEQIKRRNVELMAAAAPTEALANQIRALGDQYIALAKVGSEWSEIQKLVQDQQADSIKTFEEATGGVFDFSSGLESVAYDLDQAAQISRDLAWDIDDIARAINDNDWTSAFAGLANVLVKVEKAFASGATAADKFAAAAGVAQGLGNAIGGTGGAALSGAASGAMAGFTMGGPIGAAIGGVLGGLGGIFGSSKAKKQAKAQAEAQRLAEEAARQQQIADTRLAMRIELLRLQGKEQEAVNLERKAELDALARLDASLVAEKQALFDAIDATNAKAAADEAAAEAAERAAAVQAKAQALQDRIDALTMSDAELLAKARARERAELAAVAPELAGLIDKLFGLEDAAAAASAAVEARAEIDRLNAYGLEQAASRATEATQRQAEALAGVAAFAGEATSGLNDLISSLQDFLGEVELGPGGNVEAAYARAREALLTSTNPRDLPGLGRAFLAASEARGGDAISKARDAGLVRSLVGSALGSARSGLENLPWLARIMQAQATGLPGFAAGGSMVIGGVPGVDRNLLSLNGVPVARVGYGETLSVTPPGISNDNGMGGVVAELRALNARMERVEDASIKTARATSDTYEYQRRNGY